MKNQGFRPKMRFRDRMMQWMYGRNGGDALGRALLIVCIVLLVLNLFLQSVTVSVIELALTCYILFRMLSRNLFKRQRENAWYCARADRVKGFFRLHKNKWRDRKTHIFRKCPSCKNVLRLPKLKGKHTVNCPCCHNRFDIRV